jgi:hypothetical protein
MQCNLGKTDRIVRAVAGVLIAGAGIHYRSWWGILGLLMIATAAMGFCAAYLPFRLSTRRDAQNGGES